MLKKYDDLSSEVLKFKEFYSRQVGSLLEESSLVFGKAYKNPFPVEIQDFQDIEVKIILSKQELEDKKKEDLKEISELEEIVVNFNGVDKILAELQQTKIGLVSEYEIIKSSLNLIQEKEEEITAWEIKRQDSVILTIQTVVSAREFLQNMIELFEEGKNSILKNLDFKAIIDLDFENLINNLNDKLNNRLISENLIRGNIKPVLDELLSLVNMRTGEENPDIKEILIDWCELKFFPVSKELFSKRKKSTTYSEYFNTVLENILFVDVRVRFNENDLNKLSMGQRAIVLLKILLALDDKPLLIDQPEEHLDNRYIYSELTPAIRQAKKSRQIIIATHNANLVVNTDSEQIIISKCINGKISYESTTLEDREKRELITDILEGGEEAFSKREDRYGRRF